MARRCYPLVAHELLGREHFMNLRNITTRAVVAGATTALAAGAFVGVTSHRRPRRHGRRRLHLHHGCTPDRSFR